jgi:hypothetical protein
VNGWINKAGGKGGKPAWSAVSEWMD